MDEQLRYYGVKAGDSRIRAMDTAVVEGNLREGPPVRRRSSTMIVRHGAVVAFCLGPDSLHEVAAEAGYRFSLETGVQEGLRVRATGNLECWSGVLPCRANEAGRLHGPIEALMLSRLGPIPVIQHCSYEPAPAALPRPLLDALQKAGWQFSDSSAPWTLGSEVRGPAAIRSDDLKLGIILDAGSEGESTPVLCKQAPRSFIRPDFDRVIATGNLSCHPGTGQECVLDDSERSFFVGDVLPQGMGIAIAVLEDCELTPAMSNADTRGDLLLRGESLESGP